MMRWVGDEPNRTENDTLFVLEIFRYLYKIYKYLNLNFPPYFKIVVKETDERESDDRQKKKSTYIVDLYYRSLVCGLIYSLEKRLWWKIKRKEKAEIYFILDFKRAIRLEKERSEWVPCCSSNYYLYI